MSVIEAYISLPAVVILILAKPSDKAISLPFSIFRTVSSLGLSNVIAVPQLDCTTSDRFKLSPTTICVFGVQVIVGVFFLPVAVTLNCIVSPEPVSFIVIVLDVVLAL